MERSNLLVTLIHLEKDSAGIADVLAYLSTIESGGVTAYRPIMHGRRNGDFGSHGKRGGGRRKANRDGARQRQNPEWRVSRHRCRAKGK
ncbi:uncharacterized protein LOC143844664 isoform X4 [Paroedura picta]|uniref:uncharacterized protein LOC143844664 isoform X4 n=1 Tax=Paroedura picta TaxID=143630 RepID=UPI0040571BE9